MIAIIITTIICSFYGKGDWGPDREKGSTQVTQPFSDNLAGTLHFIIGKDLIAQGARGYKY